MATMKDKAHITKKCYKCGTTFKPKELKHVLCNRCSTMRYIMDKIIYHGLVIDVFNELKALIKRGWRPVQSR